MVVQYNPPQHLCAPPPPRCRTRNYPPFRPPIASRRIPLCRPPNCEGLEEGEPHLHVNRMATLDRIEWIKGWVIVQLFTRGQVECDEDPPHFYGHPRLGGWWADAFRGGESVTARGAAFRSGSKLWTLRWSFVTNDTLIKAKEFAYDAINYLVAWGIASKIEINPWYISRQVMRLDILVRGPGGVNTAVTVQGTAMPDSTYLWEEYRPRHRVPPLAQRYPRSRPGFEWVRPPRAA